MQGNAAPQGSQLGLGPRRGVYLTPNIITNNRSAFTIHFAYSMAGGPELPSTLLRLGFTDDKGLPRDIWRIDAVGYGQYLTEGGMCLYFYRDNVGTRTNQLLFAYAFDHTHLPVTQVTLSCSTNKWILHLNGKFMGEWSASVSSKRLLPIAPSLVFGYATNWLGSIDDVMIFNKALSTKEVLAQILA